MDSGTTLRGPRACTERRSSVFQKKLMARPLATRLSPIDAYAVPRLHTHRGYWRMPGEYPLYYIEGEWFSRRRYEGGGVSGRGAIRSGGTERTGQEHETMATFLRNKANSARTKGIPPRSMHRPASGFGS